MKSEFYFASMDRNRQPERRLPINVSEPGRVCRQSLVPEAPVVYNSHVSSRPRLTAQELKIMLLKKSSDVTAEDARRHMNEKTH